MSEEARFGGPTQLVSAYDKSFPPSTWGSTREEVAAAAHSIDEFQTPLLTLDSGALESNLAIMADWSARTGIGLAPHGKTTMVPELWRRQIDSGAWGITLATTWQVQVARSFGIQRILLANALVDPVALRWIAAELDRDASFEFSCWADSVDTVRAMDRILGSGVLERPVKVIVELGGAGGRTGVRDRGTALEIARAIVESPTLELAGCGGYEGALAHDRSEAGVTRVRDYLADLAALHAELLPLYEGRTPIVTAGGSAYFDLVEEALAPLVTEATVLLRAGAYIVHDDGFYRQISPLSQPNAGPSFTTAMHAWVRVVSRPEPGLAIIDGGKRDLPYDEGLPTAQLVRGLSAGESDGLMRGSEVSALNDQHGFLRLREGVDPDALPVGTVIRLGLSHPCTAMDKWRLVPVVDDADSVNPVVTDVLRTYF
jgi:D-serine deaminase-like pyridoxal phosphate-dependent protein